MISFSFFHNKPCHIVLDCYGTTLLTSQSLHVALSWGVLESDQGSLTGITQKDFKEWRGTLLQSFISFFPLFSCAFLYVFVSFLSFFFFYFFSPHFLSFFLSLSFLFSLKKKNLFSLAFSPLSGHFYLFLVCLNFFFNHVFQAQSWD